MPVDVEKLQLNGGVKAENCSDMNLLIIHQNFPGQFRHVAREALHRFFNVVAVGRETAPGVAGVELYRYQSSKNTCNATRAYLYRYEEAVFDGQQVYKILKKLNQSSYRPDVILAHPGWGETLFIKDVYPDVPLIHFCEYYYQSQGADLNFDPEFSCAADASSRLRILNSMHLLNLEQCDIGVSPTQWQRSLFPSAYQTKIRVVHEGVIQVSGKVESVTLPDGYVIRAGEQVVTFVARNLEPYRGFHRFMRSIPYIQAECPKAQIIIVGGDEVSYGRPPAGYKNWRERMVSEVDFELSNVHFTGRLPYPIYRAVLQLSKVHVYLTYPFVLSWSLLEAMASGCVVVGSDTAPVKEVITDGCNGFLVSFFDSEAIARNVCKVLNASVEFDEIKESARLTAGKFDVADGVRSYFEIFERAVDGQFEME